MAKVDYDKARHEAATISAAIAAGAVSSAAKDTAEVRLLGAMLREPYNMHTVLGMLNPVAMSHANSDLPQIFAEIMNQYACNGKYSTTTINTAIGKLVGAYAEVDPDLDLAWAVDNWWHEYTKWGESTAILSGLIAAGDGMLQMREVIEKERARLGLVELVAKSDGAKEFMDWAIDKIEGRERIYLTAPHIPSVRSIVKAFEPGDLVILSGRPGMGKTQAALNLHDYFAQLGVPGAFVSLEMSCLQLFGRWLGIRHGINSRGDWSAIDRAEVSRCTQDVAESGKQNPIIDDVFTIGEIEARCIQLHHVGKLQYLIVDYLQLMSNPMREGNREAEVASISRRLKMLASRLGIPIIALSQLSRAVETRGGSKRPVLSDLRESGALEQDANTVIFLYRPEYYGVMEDETGRSLKGIGEWIVAKQRSGAVDTATAKWDAIRGYTEVVEEYEPPKVYGVAPPSAAPQRDYHDREDSAPATPSIKRPNIYEDIPF